jgi:hypothetical protein
VAAARESEPESRTRIELPAGPALRPGHLMRANQRMSRRKSLYLMIPQFTFPSSPSAPLSCGGGSPACNLPGRGFFLRSCCDRRAPQNAGAAPLSLTPFLRPCCKPEKAASGRIPSADGRKLRPEIRNFGFIELNVSAEAHNCSTICTIRPLSRSREPLNDDSLIVVKKIIKTIY